MNIVAIIVLLAVSVKCELFLFPPANLENAEESLCDEYCLKVLEEKCQAGQSNLNITGLLHYYRSLVKAIFNMNEQVTLLKNKEIWIIALISSINLLSF